MNSLKHSFFYARRTSECTHRRYLYSQLGPGALTAHRSVRLVLLHSCPDTVHGFLLRETQTSAPLIKGSSAKYKPQIGITPAVADCGTGHHSPVIWNLSIDDFWSLVKWDPDII